MDNPHVTNRDGRRDRQTGFTLIEIMVVIAIIGLIATLVVPGVMNRLDEAAITTTKGKMTNLKQFIADYRRHYNKVPDTLQDLLQESEKNFNEPYVKNPNLLLDAWENEFRYNKTGSRKYEIISLGADGLEGGEGADADISSEDHKVPGQ